MQPHEETYCMALAGLIPWCRSSPASDTTGVGIHRNETFPQAGCDELSDSAVFGWPGKEPAMALISL